MRRLLPTLILVAAASARLMLSLIPGSLFSTDVWPLVRLTSILSTKPWVRIWMDEVLGGYNNHWPSTILSTSIYAVTTGLPVETVYTLHMLVLCVTTIVVFEVIARRVKCKPWVAAATLSLTPAFLVFTSACLKEVYAYPLMLIYILLSLQPGRRHLLLLPFLALSLSATHPLATLYATLFLATYTLASMLQGARPSTLIHTVILASVFTAYLLVYGLTGFRYRVGVDDLLCYTLYTVMVYGIYTLLPPSARKPRTLIALLVVAATLASLRTPIAPLQLEPMYLIYSTPYLLWVGMLSFQKLNVFEVSWLLPVTVNTLYVLFARPDLTPILHRVLGYLAFPMAASSGRGRAGLVITTACVVCSIVVIYALLTSIDALSYYWVYHNPEVKCYDIIESLVERNITVYCDAKVYYYLSHTGVKTGIITVKPRGITIVNRDDLRLGAPIQGLFRLPPSLLEQSVKGFNLVFSSGWVWVYQGP